EPALTDDCSISEPLIMGQSPGAQKQYPRCCGLLAEQRAIANTATGGKSQGAYNRREPRPQTKWPYRLPAQRTPSTSCQATSLVAVLPYSFATQTTSWGIKEGCWHTVNG